MDSSRPASLENPETELRELFGDYKAEWLRGAYSTSSPNPRTYRSSKVFVRAS